jgi:TPR repeat protein
MLANAQDICAGARGRGKEVLPTDGAGRAGHADAQYNYGSMLLYGEGGPADPRSGKDLIRRAAAKGNPCAVGFMQNNPDENA